jgi:dolichol-phosphate mannosyltransferase
VRHGDRHEGESSYTLRKLVALATDVIVAYSDKPLRLSIGFGFTMSGAAFLIGLYFLLKALLLGIPVEGWASLIVSLYFLSGIVITNLGVIGLYLGRIFDEAKRRPLYVVAEERGRGLPVPE